MSVIQNNLLMTPEGYQISRSVRLRSSASAYFNRTFGTPTSNTTWSWSGWVKRGKLGATQPFFGQTVSAGAIIGWNSSDQLTLWNNASSQVVNSTAVHRDPSAWYHVVVNSNGTTMIGYINGTQVFSYSGSITNFNSAVAHNLGASVANGVYFDGYLTEVNFIDGQALTPSSFGETDAVTGVWKPKKYAGTYGTNGFYLNFSDNSNNTAATIGKDSSGNGNNWTPNNISVTAGTTYDSMLDTPTPYADGGNGRGNYCTINPFQMAVSGPLFSLSSGNLNYSCSASSGNAGRMYSRGTMALHSGKTYWEVKVTSTNCGIGICNDAQMTDNGGGSLKSLMLFNTTQSATNTTATYTGTTFSFTTNDVIGFAFDGTAMTLGCYKNNTLIGTWSGIDSTVTWIPLFGVNASGSSTSMEANFGQRSFAYTPPTGFKALNTQNLPDATIKKGNQYFDVSTYTGNGSTQSIVNSGAMQPDLVWIKSRSNAYSHVLNDSVRGANKNLYSDSTQAEDSNAVMTAFNGNGFSVSTVGGTLAGTNGNGSTFVGWQWKESVTAGFDIVTYTGTGSAATVAHNLGVAPSMMIVRNRSDGTVNWRVYHKSIGATNFLSLNLTNASAAASSVWNNTAPTSSVFSVANDGGSNGSGNNMVAYLFAEVAGFSKFGSYTGNGSTDGPFVFCGFRPRWVMLKRTDSTSNWYIFDTARDTYNVMKTELLANSSNADADNTRWIDCLSNGFKIRNDNVSQINASGGTFVYAAFAENPFKNSLAR